MSSKPQPFRLCRTICSKHISHRIRITHSALMPKALTSSPSAKSAGAGAGQRRGKKDKKAKKEDPGSDEIEDYDEEPSAVRQRANTAGASRSGPKKEAATQPMDGDGSTCF